MFADLSFLFYHIMDEVLIIEQKTEILPEFLPQYMENFLLQSRLMGHKTKN